MWFIIIKKVDKRWIKDAKGHKDQNDLKNTVVFTDDCLGHFSLPYQFPKDIIVKGAKSQV